MAIAMGQHLMSALPELRFQPVLKRVRIRLEDSEVADYVRTLEEAKDAMDLPEASGDAIAREFERYFRRHGGAGESAGPGGI